MEGSLPFLVGLLDHSSRDIAENSSGILRNVSSYIVQCEEAEHYRYSNCIKGLQNFSTCGYVSF